MRFNTRLGSLAGIAASLALVAGCSGGGAQMPSSTQSIGQQPVGHSSQILSQHRVKGFIAAKIGALPIVQKHPVTHFASHKAITNAVFISDYANNDVNIFSFPAKTLMGTIGGLTNPQGLWTTKGGTLYVANTGASDIAIYTKPYTGSPTTLSDPGMYPTDVHVDGSGNVWVSNIISTSGGAGSVVEYPAGSTTPVTLNMSGACYECFFIATDASGNVWVDGFDSNFFPIVGYWAGGTGSFIPVGISLVFPGSLQFDSQGNLLLDDQSGNPTGGSQMDVIPPGSTTPSNTFPLSPDGTDIVTAALGSVQARIFGADADSGTCSMPIVNYPAGTIANAISNSGCAQPIGAAVTPSTLP